MNLIQPASNFMTTKLITVNPEDNLMAVKEIFDEHKIHHIPVVRYKKIVGIISKSDFLYFLKGFTQNLKDFIVDEVRLRAYKAEDIMTTGLAKVESTDMIRTVVDVLKLNRFHAIPVVDQDELVGIITTHDIIEAIAAEPIELSDYNKK